MEKFKSPKITINEKYSPIQETARKAGNGVALVDFATKGPIGEAIKFANYSNLENTFGLPNENHPFSHVLANKVLNLNVPSSVTFLRIADDSASKATAIIYNKEVSPAIANVRPLLDRDEDTYSEKGFYFNNVGTAEGVIEITVNTEDSQKVSAPFIITKEGPGGYVSIDNIIKGIKGNTIFSKLFYAEKITYNGRHFLKLIAKGIDTEIKDLAIKSKNETSAIFKIYKKPEDIAIADDGGVVTEVLPTTVDDSSIVEGKDLYYTITAKYKGSGYNGVSVVKTTDEDFQKNIIHKIGVKPLNLSTYVEEYSSEKIEDLIRIVNENSNYINIEKNEGNDREDETMLNGEYVLGEGQKIGNSYIKTSTPSVEEGTDGIPEDFEVQKNLFTEALENSSLDNTDYHDFSILATPGCGETTVQDAAIKVCESRGDAVYLVDVPQNYVEAGKTGIIPTVDWINGNRGGAITSSYAIAYYGWFPTQTVFDKNPIVCPASVFLALNFIQIDETQGAFFVPAGVRNGRIIVNDFTYSPNTQERETLLYNGNINPIIFSNTRGVLALSQKTCDRTDSPFNRISVRRMTNKIKKELKNSLETVMFLPNSDSTRTHANGLIAKILRFYVNANMIERFNVSISSGTGADRNSLYASASFVPYGLVENIVVNLEITDSAIKVTEQ